MSVLSIIILVLFVTILVEDLWRKLAEKRTYQLLEAGFAALVGIFCFYIFFTHPDFSNLIWLICGWLYSSSSYKSFRITLSKLSKNPS